MHSKCYQKSWIFCNVIFNRVDGDAIGQPCAANVIKGAEIFTKREGDVTAVYHVH